MAVTTTGVVCTCPAGLAHAVRPAFGGRRLTSVCSKRFAYVASTLKKRFLLFDRLPAALAPHTRASGRSRGPDTTQKPHRSREKMVSWPSAAFGIGGRPRRVASPAPGVRKMHSRDFGGSEERLLLNLWLSPQQRVEHWWASVLVLGACVLRLVRAELPAKPRLPSDHVPWAFRSVAPA